MNNMDEFKISPNAPAWLVEAIKKKLQQKKQEPEVELKKRDLPSEFFNNDPYANTADVLTHPGETEEERFQRLKRTMFKK